MDRLCKLVVVHSERDDKKTQRTSLYTVTNDKDCHDQKKKGHNSKASPWTDRMLWIKKIYTGIQQQKTKNNDCQLDMVSAILLASKTLISLMLLLSTWNQPATRGRTGVCIGKISRYILLHFWCWSNTLTTHQLSKSTIYAQKLLLLILLLASLVDDPLSANSIHQLNLDFKHFPIDNAY